MLNKEREKEEAKKQKQKRDTAHHSNSFNKY